MRENIKRLGCSPSKAQNCRKDDYSATWMCWANGFMACRAIVCQSVMVKVQLISSQPNGKDCRLIRTGITIGKCVSNERMEVHIHQNDFFYVNKVTLAHLTSRWWLVRIWNVLLEKTQSRRLDDKTWSSGGVSVSGLPYQEFIKSRGSVGTIQSTIHSRVNDWKITRNTNESI